MGGVPKKALYIVGHSENEFVYLDPHYVQNFVDSKNLLENYETFFSSVLFDPWTCPLVSCPSSWPQLMKFLGLLYWPRICFSWYQIIIISWKYLSTYICWYKAYCQGIFSWWWNSELSGQTPSFWSFSISSLTSFPLEKTKEPHKFEL